EVRLTERAAALATTSNRPAAAEGIALPLLERRVTDDAINYRHIRVALNRAGRRATITISGPPNVPNAAGIHHQGADFWPLAMARELDDAILHLRFNEPELGILVFRSEGDRDAVIGTDILLEQNADDW